jgi:hypothetical protein
MNGEIQLTQRVKAGEKYNEKLRVVLRELEKDRVPHETVLRLLLASVEYS